MQPDLVQRIDLEILQMPLITLKTPIYPNNHKTLNITADPNTLVTEGRTCFSVETSDGTEELVEITRISSKVVPVTAKSRGCRGGTKELLYLRIVNESRRDSIRIML
jgi:hypothetical protein